MKNTFYAILFIIANQTFAQDIVWEKELYLQSAYGGSYEAYSLKIPNDNFILFFLSSEAIHGISFDSKFQSLQEFSLKRDKYKFQELLGHNLNTGSVTLYFTNKNKNAIASKTIDFKGISGPTEVLSVKLKGEEILETATYNGNLYLFTIDKWSSLVKIYVLNEGKLIRTKNIDLSNFIFDQKPDYANLYSALHKSINPNEKVIIKVDENKFNLFELSAFKNKFYSYENKIYITIDDEIKNTKIVEIDLIDFSHDVKTFYHKNLGCDKRKNSNSFLANNTLYQIISCKHELYISLVNFLEYKVVQKFNLKEEDSLYFKNSYVIQQGSSNSMVENKVINGTKELLKNISTGAIAISAFNSKDTVDLTIGTYNVVTHKSGSFNTPTGNIPFHIKENAEFHSSTSFKSVLNSSTFEHIPGSSKQSSIEMINSYLKALDNNKLYTTVLKFNDGFILGYYDKNSNRYFLRSYR